MITKGMFYKLKRENKKLKQKLKNNDSLFQLKHDYIVFLEKKYNDLLEKYNELKEGEKENE